MPKSLDKEWQILLDLDFVLVALLMQLTIIIEHLLSTTNRSGGTKYNKLL